MKLAVLAEVAATTSCDEIDVGIRIQLVENENGREQLWVQKRRLRVVLGERSSHP